MKRWQRWRGRLGAWSAVMTVLSLVLVGTGSQASAGIAGEGKFLGNILAGSRVPADFATYWNQVTPENEGKWGAVEATRDTLDWTALDGQYQYAAGQGFPVRYHTLVWGSQEPAWVAGLPADDQKAEVSEWIAEAGARYDARTAFVDVVNEPLHAPPSYAEAIGGAGTTGWDWVVWSFQQARAAFPTAKLALNEYGIINDITAARRYAAIARILKDRGLIDAIGIQCHYFNLERAQPNEMRAVLDELASTGLPIYVTELDLTGSDSVQLGKYQDKFPILWEHPAVKGVTLWGYEEGRTWSRNAHLVRADGSRRPALSWLESYVASSGL